MDTIDYFRQFIAAAHGQVDDALTDITLDEFNWTPPGTASPISAVLVHLLTSEDFFLQSVLQGMHQVWDKGGWQEQTGVKNTPGYGGNWEEFKHMKVALEPVLAYQQAVRAVTDSYLQKLRLDMLPKRVELGGEETCVADVLVLLTRHVLCHAGEIAVLKGIQGSRGLPY
jgi:uncharacterized damage-inducible protein DinB